MSDTLAVFLDRAKFYAGDAFVTISQFCCKPDATLKINGRQYKIERLLGEGGESNRVWCHATSDESVSYTDAIGAVWDYLY